MEISELRKEIRARFPNLKFKVRTVSFTNLARDGKVFVESSEWGMTKGNHEIYQAVKVIVDKYGAIASW